MTIRQKTVKATKFLRNIFLAGLTLAGTIWATHAYTSYHMEVEMAARIDNVVVHELDEAYGQFGTEVHMLSRLVVAEIGGHPAEWDKVLAAVFHRVDSDQFPNSIEEVVKQLRSNGQGCQFDGMCDRKMELMVTDQGQVAREFVFKNLRAYYDGSYVSPLPGVHSFCVPASCERSKGYFGQFELLAEHDGHQYFGGTAKKETSVSKLAVAESPRPMTRPNLEDDSMAAAIAAPIRLAQD